MIHIISIFLVNAINMSISKNNFPNYTIIICVLSVFIQVIYVFVFRKKIVFEKYASSILRTVTISFIVSNIYLAIIFLSGYLYGYFFLSLAQLIISMFFVSTATCLITIYLRKNDFLARIKTRFVLIKDFSFPFYKISGIIPMFFLLPCIFFKSKVYLGFSLTLLVVGMIYTGLGEYFYTKRKDELDRLIKYEASYIAMQLLPGFFIPLFFIETIWKIQVPWFPVMMIFIFIHLLVQTIINRKYE